MKIKISTSTIDVPHFLTYSKKFQYMQHQLDAESVKGTRVGALTLNRMEIMISKHDGLKILKMTMINSP